MTRSILVGCLFALIWQLSMQADPYEAQERIIQTVANRVGSSVVRIETSGGQDQIVWGGRNQPIRKVAGPTTGLIIDSDGYVLTSSFNFSNKPTDIFVTVPGKGRTVAKVVGTDNSRMLTLLRIEMNQLPVPIAMPKSEMIIGMTTIALGRVVEFNSEKLPTVNVGILSALGRIWGKAVQTDAKISPNNYGGPLVSLDGRVLGILVPASPTAEGENAGIEWYDSGIGFAIPLEDVAKILPKLKAGTAENPVTLRPGLLGVTFKSNDLYSVVPTINSVAPNSTAAKAELKSGDVILEMDGKPTLSQAQLMHQLKPKYEGDTVSLKVQRGKDIKEYKNLTLLGTQTDFENGFLGILPMRDDPEPGVQVRYVYPESPAAKAGLKAGDRITKVGPSAAKEPAPFAGRDALLAFLSLQPNGSDIQLEFTPVGEKNSKKANVVLTRFPEYIPMNAQPEASKKRASEQARNLNPKSKPKKTEPEAPAPKEEKKLETGLIRKKNAEQGREYWVYVPTNYDPNMSYGLMVWLHGAGNQGRDADDLVDLWSTACSLHQMIILGPISKNQDGWVPTESEFILGDIQNVIADYRIDTSRILAHGQGIGGQMAFYLGFQARDRFRGIAAHGAVLASTPKPNQPGPKLQFFISAGQSDPIIKDIQESQNKLKTNKFPVIYKPLENIGKQYLDASPSTFLELINWMDSLDRM